MDAIAAENARLRFLLWKCHSHKVKYGDDGEIQCQGIDFKRDPIAAIERHLLTDVERALEASWKANQAAS